MSFQQAQFHSMARPMIAPGALDHAEADQDENRGEQASWWEGGRFIGLASLALWIGIWRLVSALL